MTTVVMTRNRWPDLRRTLGRHDPPVIVVDNGSTDGTPGLVRRHFPEVSVVELGSNHGAVARNVGVALATTPYVAFADDDSWWEGDGLDRVADILDAHPDVGAVAGRVLVGEDGHVDPVTTAHRASRLGRDPRLPGPSVIGFSACGAVVRRSAFVQTGGFDDVTFFAGEEDRLALDLAALGWRQVYLDRAVVRHLPAHRRCRVRRREQAARNKVLTAVMRRPWRVVLGTAVGVLRLPGGVPGLVQSVPRLPRALARRRVVPAEVERSVRRIES